MRTSQVSRIDSGTLLDFIPPLTIVGVNVIRESARSIEAKRGLSGCISAIMASTLAGEGRSSMAKVERWSKRVVEVSRSGS